MAQAPQEHPGWSRDFLSVRLTQQRARTLKSICSATDEILSPTEALDQALSLASAAHASPGPSNGPLGAGFYTPQCPDFDLVHELELQRVEISSLAREVRRLLALAPFHGGEAPSLDISEKSTASPLKQWLDAEAFAHGEAAFVARAMWLSKTRSSERTLTLNMSIHSLGVVSDDAPVTVRKESIASLSGLDVASPLAAASAINGIYFACKRLDGGSWALTAYEVAAGGGIGHLIDTMAVG